MAKISEAKEKGTGSSKFFTSKEIVGQPFEITGSENALSDFRETEKKEGKKGTWLIIEINLGGEIKDLHLTNSAMRALRDCMPPGIATWKGQRAVMNSDAKGFIPAKFTRLMGDFAAAQGQTQLGQPPVPQPEQFPQAPETLEQKKVRFLVGLGTSPGIHDSRIMDVLISVFGDRGTGEFIFNMLKGAGQIKQLEGGQWVRT